jgi:hypothetical protein
MLFADAQPILQLPISSIVTGLVPGFASAARTPGSDVTAFGPWSLLRSSLLTVGIECGRRFASRKTTILWEAGMISGNLTVRSFGAELRRNPVILGFAAAMVIGFGALAMAQPAAGSATFDGEYAGRATPGYAASRYASLCNFILDSLMTIAALRVTVRSFRAGQPLHTYSGTVDPSGRVSASARWQYTASDFVLMIDDSSLSGNIVGANFTGQLVIKNSRGSCGWDVNMTKQQSP